MNVTDIAILTVGGFGLAFGGFVLWLIWPRDDVPQSSKPDIKPAE